MSRKLTREDFIQRAKEIHSDRYDYSKIEYIDAKTKVNIIYPEHGYFWQRPESHLRRHGCSKCANILITKSNTYTTIDFIKKAKEVHGDKYDYSKVQYINSKTKIKIICPIHGVFFQTPSDHIQGRGCPKCSGVHKLTTKEFIKESKNIHGEKYDYSKVNYINNKTKVKIICPEHGLFWQEPASHLHGNGCPRCGGTLKLTDKDFIQSAKEVHGDKYDYSKVNYINNHTKVIITCPKHGEFKQLPYSHLQGKGCPKCAGIESPQELKIRKLLEDNNTIFEHNNIIDNRYPYHVDIYIPERDLFIEYNGYWTHGDEWCDKTNATSKACIEKWSKTDSPQYKTAIETYTKRDVLKRKTAKQNNLNYVVLWDEKDIDKWFELGCPDGHDYDYEYSWIKDDKERKEWIRTKKK